jgi:tetratricopeptide (TPR) repeat protein
MPWYSVFSAEDTALNVQTAQQAMARGDLQHAFFHIGSALTTDPLNADWRGMLDDVIRRVPDAEVFARSDQAKFDFITLAGRAYVRASKHDFGSALPLLAQVANARADAPFLLWGREWVRQHPSALLLKDDQLLDLIKATLPWVSNAPSPAGEDDPRRPNLEAMADIFTALRQPFGRHPLVLYASSCVLRRLGRFDEAIQLAHQGWEIDKSWNMTIGVACALRDAKRVDEAMQWYRQALEQQPTDPSPLLDTGDMLLDADRYDEAIGIYGQILQHQPKHEWAEPSTLYAQWKKAQLPAAKEQLRQLAAAGNGRARALMDRIDPPRIYVNRLPAPGDTTIPAISNLMYMLEREPAKGRGGSMGIDIQYPESPSVLTAFRVWSGPRGFHIGVTLNVAHVQQPDPRVPKGQVDFVLWAFDGAVPRPAVAPPDARVWPPIANIARMPFDLAQWEAPARDLAGQMGPGWIPQLACALVHPPPLPAPNEDPFFWVLRCQIATALVIGSIAPQEPWAASTRRRALSTILLGPTDWTTDAAIVALAWIGQRDASARADVEQTFTHMQTLIPQEGFTSWELTLCHAWLSMGGHGAETQQRLEQWKARIAGKEKKAAETGGAEETRGGMTLAQYAEERVRRESMPAAVPWRIPEWDRIINADKAVQDDYMRLMNVARMKRQGIDPTSNEARAAEMIRKGAFDVEGAKQNAVAAQQQIAAGGGGDPDPLVFPGQKVAKLSDYVGLMKGMQTGDMMGALKRAGLSMGEYTQVAQAWGLKMATDPTLTAKFSKMMTGQ